MIPLSIDINAGKKLSFAEIIPPPELPKEPTTEEIAYSKLVAINPIVEELVERLELVSVYTGKPIQKIKLPQEIIDRINKVNIVI